MRKVMLKPENMTLREIVGSGICRDANWTGAKRKIDRQTVLICPRCGVRERARGKPAGGRRLGQLRTYCAECRPLAAAEHAKRYSALRTKPHLCKKCKQRPPAKHPNGKGWNRLCAECAAQRRDKALMCKRCGEHPRIRHSWGLAKTCGICREEKRAEMARIRQGWVHGGLCPRCGERPRRPGRHRPEPYCYECHREIERERSARKRAERMEARP